MNAPFGKYYKVKSLHIDTQKKIEQNNIWYYCDKVWTILGSDLKRSNGIYVKLYKDRKGNKSHSIDIDKDIDTNQIEINFTWWQRNGGWIILVIVFCAVVFKIFNNTNSKYKVANLIRAFFLVIAYTEFAKRGHSGKNVSVFFIFLLYSATPIILSLKMRLLNEKEYLTLLYKYKGSKIPEKYNKPILNPGEYIALFCNSLLLILAYMASSDIQSFNFILGLQIFIFFTLSYLV